MNNHNIPASVWKVNVDVLKRFLVFTVACTCVGVVYMQWTYIWMLRAEMAEITQRFRPLDTAGKEGGICCDAAVCYGVSCYHRFLERRKHEGGRDKRDVTEQKKQRKRRQTEKHTFLHLVPVSSQSYNDHDTTVLSWALGQSRGEGLQVSGDTVTVEAEGTYFIYSQVLYKDTTWVMGHVITKRLKGAETKLMKCLKSMPSNVSQPLNTCYTAGIHFLESGSSLQLSVPRKSAELILTAHATFMGLFSI
ncbi:tumor necrosis factor ligand superfamily member 13 isoform X2 [Ctenopharyngodon idella]|uniref:tumor necrosis factor ligand superfamily member 13 isoform X1 n=1 Tax=Ctenopharyngodon idella TaxID=7959 RepID=UPI00222E61CC|nr:tumor necrosis factor ligand superfamily member 13 isoform X1 [Ctenopharyngodon idella]XP_051749375.1 tumor necrosis factor ligand superfamily member 13 isoform X2 [Ctenopharyngodon idella]